MVVELSARSKRLLSHGVTLIVVFSALVGIVQGLEPGKVPWWGWGLVAVAGVTLLIAIDVITSRELSIDFAPLADDEGGQASHLIVAPPPPLRAVANKHSLKLFPRDYVPLSITSTWWVKNPFCLAVLRSRSGEYLGYFNCLPLTANAMRRIEEGKETERTITSNDILPPRLMRTAKTLYLPAIAVRDAGTEAGRQRAAAIFAALPKYFEMFYGNEPRRLVAAAATADGERVLRSLGAMIISPKEAREDRHDLYEIALTPGLAQIVSRRAKRRSAPVPVRLYDPTGELKATLEAIKASS